MSEPTKINPLLRISFQTSRSSLQSDDRWVERLDIFVTKKDKGLLKRIKMNILPPGSGSVEKGAWSMTMTKPVTMTTMMMMMMTVNDNESKKMRDPFRREIDFPLSFPFSVCRICKRFLILCIAKENFSKVFFQPFNILLSGLWELQYLIISWQN